jgi:hypothetical protein
MGKFGHEDGSANQAEFDAHTDDEARHYEHGEVLRGGLERGRDDEEAAAQLNGSESSKSIGKPDSERTGNNLGPRVRQNRMQDKVTA